MNHINNTIKSKKNKYLTEQDHGNRMKTYLNQNFDLKVLKNDWRRISM